MNTLSPEKEVLLPVSELTEDDQVWLESFGVDPAWQEDETLRDELSKIIQLGSIRLPNHYDEDVNRDDVVEARGMFMEFLGVDEALLEAKYEHKPTKIPIDTFIRAQRFFVEQGIDPQKIMKGNIGAVTFETATIRSKLDNLESLGFEPIEMVNSAPELLCFTTENIRSKIEGFTQLGLDVHKVISSQPTLLANNLETIKVKLDNLNELGLDALAVVNKYPPALVLAADSLGSKVRAMVDLGLDVPKITRKYPRILGSAQDTVAEKYAYLDSLGYNTNELINSCPGILSHSSATVADKLRFLQRSLDVLRWEGTVEEIVETFPGILSFSTKKLAIMRRLAATTISGAERNASPQDIRNTLFHPLESHLIAQHSLGLEDITIKTETSAALQVHTSPEERKTKALVLAKSGALGRLGSMYLDYRGEPR